MKVKYKYTNIKQFLKVAKDLEGFKTAIPFSSTKLLNDVFNERAIPLCNILNRKDLSAGIMALGREIGCR